MYSLSSAATKVPPTVTLSVQNFLNAETIEKEFDSFLARAAKFVPNLWTRMPHETFCTYNPSILLTADPFWHCYLNTISPAAIENATINMAMQNQITP
jgi:hypothetical protein